MSLEIAGIQSYKNEIYFKKKEKLKDSKPQKENEDKESYFKRNKKAMLALSALGIAGIAIATHHHFKKTIKLNSGDLSELLSKSAKEKLEAFESKLSKEDAFEDIKNILAEDNNILKFEAIKQIIYKGAKHINKNSWEYIFNSVTNLKPTKQLKERFIIICTNNLLKVMQEKSLFSPEAIDQILLKTESLNDNFKINILHSLSESHFDRKSYREIRPDFSTEQMNKISDILEKIKGNDFLYHGRDFDTVIFPAGVRYQFNNIQFKNLKLNKNYISQFKKVIESDKLPDDLKLQLIDDIYYNVLIDRRSEYAIQLCKEMLLALEKNKADEYSLPNQFISFVHSKFGLGCRILNTITNYDSQNIVSLEEKFRFNQMLKKMSESIKITKGHITGNSGDINNLYNQELRLKSDIFFKNFSDKTTLTDIENFVNEMLNT